MRSLSFVTIMSMLFFSACGMNLNDESENLSSASIGKGDTEGQSEISLVQNIDQGGCQVICSLSTRVGGATAGDSGQECDVTGINSPALPSYDIFDQGKHYSNSMPNLVLWRAENENFDLDIKASNICGGKLFTKDAADRISAEVLELKLYSSLNNNQLTTRVGFTQSYGSSSKPTREAMFEMLLGEIQSPNPEPGCHYFAYLDITCTVAEM